MEEFLKTWYGVLAFVAFDILALLAVICITYRYLFKRILDAVVAFVCLLALSPLYAVILIRACIAKKNGHINSVLQKEKFVGKKGKTVALSQFAYENADGEIACAYGDWIHRTKLYKWAFFLDILLGKRSFIGCKALKESDCVFLTDEEELRHIAPIGVINPLVVTGKKDTDYEDMLLSDNAYAQRFSFFGDCKIFFTWLLKNIRGEGTEYLGSTQTCAYIDELLKDNRITQEDYDEAKKQDE